MNQSQEEVDVIDAVTLLQLQPKLQKIFSESMANLYLKLINDTIEENNEECDWSNTKISLMDGVKSFHIISGRGSHNWVIYTEDGNVDIVKSVRRRYLDEFISASVINKRVIGKAIVKYVGNEGADADERKEGLRRLLQATIDYIQTHLIEGIWENATITVYDSANNTFKFQSGTGKNKFLVNESKGRPSIKYTVNNKVKELKPPLNEANASGIEGVWLRMRGLCSRWGNNSRSNEQAK